MGQSTWRNLANQGPQEASTIPELLQICTPFCGHYLFAFHADNPLEDNFPFRKSFAVPLGLEGSGSRGS